MDVDYAALVEDAIAQAEAQAAPVVVDSDRDPIAWIEQNFFIPERQYQTPPAIQLYPHQRAVLREAYRKDETGRFVYSIVVWSDIKKSAKSSIAAAVALERAERSAWGSVKVVANDLKQADSRVSYYARRAIQLNPALAASVKVSGTRITFPNRAVIEAVPVDPGGEAGGNDDLIIFSELWAAKGKAAQQMWTEMTLSPTKFGYSQRWVETYAGFSGKAPTLEQLYDQGVKQGRRLDLSYEENGAFHDLSDLEVFANERTGLLCLWNTKPRLPWQTKAYYAAEQGVLLPSEFDRVHGNKWQSSTEAFIQPEWWDACLGALPKISPYTPLVASVDAGVSNDCFAIVVVARIRGICFVVYAKAWKAEPGKTIDFKEPEAVIRYLAQKFNVLVWAYDPYQLHKMCTDLRNEGVGRFEEFPQGSDRNEADKALYDRITHRQIVHSGNATLSEHVKNADVKKEGDNKIRLVKRSDAMKIDLAVALAMACHKADELRIGD